MIISMVGCNAVGKSTAARRYAARYPMLKVVSADTQLELHNGVEERVREWKGTVDDKRLMVEKTYQHPVALVESARTTHLEFLKPGSPIIIVTASAEMYKANMVARCLLKGKKFRYDYWTDFKLGYESHTRYINYARKNLTQHRVIYFKVEDKAKDWPAIDECFTKLFREYWNRRDKS